MHQSNYDKIHKTVYEIKSLENKNILPPLKDLIQKTNFNELSGASVFFELLLKNQISLNRDLPQIEELMGKIPRISNEKFKKAEMNEIVKIGSTIQVPYTGIRKIKN